MKGAKMMNLRKIILITAVALVIVPLTAIPTLAGTTPGPPTDGTIVGPELWGVVVVTCPAPNIGTLRIKQIDANCNVFKQAHWLDFSDVGCPVEDNVWYRELPTVKLRAVDGSIINDTNSGLTPIFVRIKNFETETTTEVAGTISFDVLIKFVKR
jgi:hypothetical protein